MRVRYLCQACAEAQPSGVLMGESSKAKVVSETVGTSAIALVRDTAKFGSTRLSEKPTELARSGLVVEVVVELVESKFGHGRFAISSKCKSQRVSQSSAAEY